MVLVSYLRPIKLGMFLLAFAWVAVVKNRGWMSCLGGMISCSCWWVYGYESEVSALVRGEQKKSI